MAESPIFVKMFDFTAWVIPLRVKAPREQRFVVAAALQRVTLAAHEALIRAGHSQTSTATLAHLNEAAAQLAVVRFYLRLAQTLNLMTIKQYEHASERLPEIGRLTRAWQRACRTKIDMATTAAISTTEAVPGAPAL